MKIKTKTYITNIQMYEGNTPTHCPLCGHDFTKPALYYSRWDISTPLKAECRMRHIYDNHSATKDGTICYHHMYKDVATDAMVVVSEATAKNGLDALRLMTRKERWEKANDPLHQHTTYDPKACLQDD